MVEDQFGIQFRWQEITPPFTDAQQKKYMQGVRRDLTQILKSRAGQIMAASFRYRLSTIPKPYNVVWIYPYPEGACNGDAPSDLGMTPEQFVRFNPDDPDCADFRGLPGFLSHEILHHELVHALRGLSGHRDMKPLTGRMAKFTQFEDFCAILATNIFQSDPTNLRKSRLRVDHESFDPLPRKLATSFGYFTLGIRCYNMVANFCFQNPAYTKMLARVDAVFNPIAAFLKHPDKTMNIAMDREADDVFYNIFDPGVEGHDFLQGSDRVWRRQNIRPFPGIPDLPPSPVLRGH